MNADEQLRDTLIVPFFSSQFAKNNRIKKQKRNEVKTDLFSFSLSRFHRNLLTKFSNNLKQNDFKKNSGCDQTTTCTNLIPCVV